MWNTQSFGLSEMQRYQNSQSCGRKQWRLGLIHIVARIDLRRDAAAPEGSDHRDNPNHPKF
jgi:hypothetical protein